MTWIDDNKGSGPWNFTEQPQKLGYINNPNFTEEATPTHSPCGYWFKNYVEAAQVNSYVYTDATVFGYNVLGVLGLYNFILQRSPVSQPYFPKIKYVSLGNKHAHIIDSNNQLWAVGADYYGSLGAGTLNQHKHHIIQIGTKQWSFVAAGYNHSFAIDTDGYLYATGRNPYGVLGLGDSTERHSFTKVGTKTWSYIKTDSFGTHAIDTDGQLWGCGYDGVAGYLGTGGYDGSSTFIPIGVYPTFVAKGDYVSFITIGSILYCLGRNTSGQLGLGDNITRDIFTEALFGSYSHLSCGSAHTCVISADGYLYATGYNGHGQLGLGDYDNRNVFTKIGNDKWIAVECGSYITHAIKEDGSVWATGGNGNGELGVGDLTDRNVFTLVDEGPFDYIATGFSRHDTFLFNKEEVWS
ncbi:MAG: hypothetical protein JRE47_13590 [Deltaproteobacteria bacterium]|nr:hypothetical protein [Deltaproteobacteria bacterium]